MQLEFWPEPAPKPEKWTLRSPVSATCCSCLSSNVDTEIFSRNLDICECANCGTVFKVYVGGD